MGWQRVDIQIFIIILVHAVAWQTGNYIVATIFAIIFLSARIRAHKNLGVDLFPVSYFETPWWTFCVLQVVLRFRQCTRNPRMARPVLKIQGVS